MKDAEFLKVDPKSRTLYYKWTVIIPATDKTERIDIVYEACVTFD